MGDEWIQVTSNSRQCKDTKDSKLIKSIDILFGNMVQNATGVRNGGVPIPHSPPKKQLVSKSDAGDAFIHNCLIGCIYFLPEYNVSDYHTNLAATLFVLGGISFTFSGLILQYRYFVAEIPQILYSH